MVSIQNRHDRNELFDPYATDAATNRRFNLADEIGDWLAARRGATFPPSQVARGVGCNTHDAWEVLEYLADNQYITAIGNGSRGRYTYGR